ncbi:PREDICTED: alcohol dehydrogenase-related 31 kDa protein-like isoform X3 [Rhagoletis zephyria]|uniref:alcohol dehydrogenase-related 31 kDa protein-like isoform X3 n=1 Tax=Rhagoletis zephyria TaxID=28612 RepID=UPI0008113896|nr:PREDICTED: alcohol dehydrogenase-related 31 kDa protein-like isoform X3 [Rhagoletis zephyria]XP_036320948.1 alcohol dehydrogenase-related 31 kDa protein-like isoform X2 [Rhagoletis pomonella]
MAHNVEENTFNLYAKNVVYIGGFGGIGVETCKQLLQKGVANLMILDKTWNESAHKELNAVDTQRVFQFMEFDITCGLDKTRQVFARIMEKFGYIDVLINGAGICDEQDYDLIIAVNFTGTINATLVAYDLMDRSRDGQGGVVVNISSVAALTPFPVLPIYSGTKGGVLSFTRALSVASGTENWHNFIHDLPRHNRHQTLGQCKLFSTEESPFKREIAWENIPLTDASRLCNKYSQNY